MSDFQPPFISPFPPHKPSLFYAEMVYERIESHFQELYDALQEDEELSVFIPLADGTRVQVEGLGFQNPGFIIVYAQGTEGQSIQAMISHTNIQVLFIRSKKQSQQPKRHIGFRSGS